MKQTCTKALLLLGTTLCLSACGSLDRLTSIGAQPKPTDIENPQLAKNYKPVSMPMPTPKETHLASNSLWDSNRQTFFKDQRAADVGDIVTVLITINDQAKLQDETKRQRTEGETAGLPNFFGAEGKLSNIFGTATTPSSLVNANSTSNHDGNASINRQEQVDVRLAATVTQVLPNGNFVIHGVQQMMVNYERRDVDIDGIVRPQDISIGNTVNYDQVAEARITYGGKGQLMDIQQERYGQQLYDIVMPF